MKYLLILLLIFTACTRGIQVKPEIQEIVACKHHNHCFYYFKWVENDQVYFIDSCGKYQIGDTFK